MSREADRKFSDWTYRDLSVWPDSIKLEIRYTGGLQNIVDKPPVFYVETLTPIPIREESPNLQTLLKKVVAAIKVYAIEQPEWIPELVVEFNTNADNQFEFNMERGAKFSVEQRFVATLPNGQKIVKKPCSPSTGRWTRNSEGYDLRWFGKWDGVDHVEKEEEEGTSGVVLPDTTENRTALTALATAFDSLSLRLHQLAKIARKTKALPAGTIK